MNSMRFGASALAAMIVAIAGCSPGAETPAADNTRPATGGGVADFKAEISMQELMAHVIDYNADGVWLRQGWVHTADGIQELFPTTPEEWLAAENAALTLAESANLLLLPGRPLDDSRAWVDLSRGMYDAALRAARAAEKAAETGDMRDKQAFFDAGGEIYQVCRSCHERYVIGSVR